MSELPDCTDCGNPPETWERLCRGHFVGCPCTTVNGKTAEEAAKRWRRIQGQDDDDPLDLRPTSTRRLATVDPEELAALRRVAKIAADRFYVSQEVWLETLDHALGELLAFGGDK